MFHTMEEQEYIDRNLELYESILNNLSQKSMNIMEKVYSLLPTDRHKGIYNKIRKLDQ